MDNIIYIFIFHYIIRSTYILNTIYIYIRGPSEYSEFLPLVNTEILTSAKNNIYNTSTIKYNGSHCMSMSRRQSINFYKNYNNTFNIVCAPIKTNKAQNTNYMLRKLFLISENNIIDI